MSDEQILELGQRWADAERQADIAALDTLLADDFLAVGPRGFVLTRQQYLEPRRAGDLKTEAFAWQEVSVRHYGAVAVAVGIQAQTASYQGQDASGRFRTTQVAVQVAGRWLLAGLHISGPIPDLPPRQG